MLSAMQLNHEERESIARTVQAALREDVGTGDVTAAIIAEGSRARATVIARETGILAGQPWADEVCRQVDEQIEFSWYVADGQAFAADTTLCELFGPARSLLTAERSALNFLQLLSAVATQTNTCVQAVSGTNCRVLDTRKTIPGLRLAQKYAVRCGGGVNHRTGLFDAILIKENHVASAGNIAAAIGVARQQRPDLLLEVEVESLAELDQALAAKADRILLDNFSGDLLTAAVQRNAEHEDWQAELEASGGITLDTIAAIAATGVDYVSVGALTKDVNAIDLSMRFDELVDGE